MEFPGRFDAEHFGVEPNMFEINEPIEALRNWLQATGMKPDTMSDFSELPSELYATESDTDILAPPAPE
jgi:hypothetical protein